MFIYIRVLFNPQTFHFLHVYSVRYLSKCSNNISKIKTTCRLLATSPFVYAKLGAAPLMGYYPLSNKLIYVN